MVKTLFAILMIITVNLMITINNSNTVTIITRLQLLLSQNIKIRDQ